jgi:aspartate carbamoyltransferase catalytic subunit
MADAFGDAIVLRHPLEGAARLASEHSNIPVINAGDGAGQHPTQTLLDLFTIKQAKGKIEGNKVILLGDLKYGRTVHSMAHALAMFGVEIVFVSPKGLEMPREVIRAISSLGAEPRETHDLASALPDADVLYVTRIQRERFPDVEDYLKVAGTYRIDIELLKKAKSDLIVMHPLPRVDEIAKEVDSTPHAWYFKQAFSAIPVRMAILKLIIEGDAA